jgi:hypothetical protein
MKGSKHYPNLISSLFLSNSNFDSLLPFLSICSVPHFKRLCYISSAHDFSLHCVTRQQHRLSFLCIYYSNTHWNTENKNCWEKDHISTEPTVHKSLYWDPITFIKYFLIYFMLNTGQYNNANWWVKRKMQELG